MKSHIYSQVIFNKGAKAIKWEKEKYFQQMVLELGIYKEKKNFDHYIIPYTKINFRWIMDLHI